MPLIAENDRISYPLYKKTEWGLVYMSEQPHAFPLKAIWKVAALLSLVFPLPLLPQPSPSIPASALAPLSLFLAFNRHPFTLPPLSLDGMRNEGRKESVEILFQTKLDGEKL